MDATFLQLISLLVNLSNQVKALQEENAVLKSGLPVEEPESTSPVSRDR